MFPCEFCKISLAVCSYRKPPLSTSDRQSDFQTKGLQREREREKDRERERERESLKSITADISSITMPYINAIKKKKPLYQTFG